MGDCMSTRSSYFFFDADAATASFGIVIVLVSENDFAPGLVRRTVLYEASVSLSMSESIDCVAMFLADTRGSSFADLAAIKAGASKRLPLTLATVEAAAGPAAPSASVVAVASVIAPLTKAVTC